MFRLKDNDTGFWLEGFDDDMNYVWTSNKADALVFPPEKREFWEDDPDYEIVPLAEDEIMAQLGVRRLPGFE